MNKILLLLLTLSVLFLTSCAKQNQKNTGSSSTAAMDSTVADLARVVESSELAVRGFGIVAGLFGTGSAECPVELRQELEKFIWQQIPQAGAISPRRFIESLDTAVVEVVGVIPAMALAGQNFDIVLRPLSQTQTTSLSGGHLYTTDLKEMSRYTQFNQFANTIARAQGPVFAVPNSASTPASWYVLGGGYPITNTNISLLLNTPDFLAAGAIRNRINERFGLKTANAVSAGEILISIPPAYQTDKLRFLSLIRQLYLAEQPALKSKRIEMLVGQLQTLPEKFIAEVSLEAIGRPALDGLSPLLKSDDAAVRFHTARCMANIGDSRPLGVLREFVFDPQSPYRADAIRTIGHAMRLSDAEPILLRAMGLEEIELRVIAYETALATRSTHISRTLVAGSFYVDRILCGGPKVVYTMQKDRPGIVVFGSPVRCTDNVFMQSDDGQITLNARVGDKFLSVSRNHPGRPRVIGPLASGFELTQMVRSLGESPEIKQGSTALPGLALSYSQIIELIEKMCKNEVLNAAYYPGTLTDAGKLLQNL